MKGFSDHIRPGETIDVPYSEGVFIGYRWYDKHRIPYVFPFGYGLSYTSFTYESIACEDRMEREGRVLVTVRVRNGGGRAGKEIVQLYVSDTRSSVERPEKELKAFAKVALEPGESKTVTLELTAAVFRSGIPNPTAGNWSEANSYSRAEVPVQTPLSTVLNL